MNLAFVDQEKNTSIAVEEQEIIGKADAKAMDIYAKAYSKDPEFYNYYKTVV